MAGFGVPLPYDPQAVLNLAGKAYDILKKHLEDKGVSGFVREDVASSVAGGLLQVEPTVSLIVSVLVSLLEPVLKAAVKVIHDVRQTDQPEFNDLIGGALGELLGVEISGADIPIGSGTAGAAARAQAIGSKLHDLLMQEFGGLSPISAQTGADNARKFTGFAINFGLVTAVLAFLGGLVPIGHVDEIRAFGEEIAKNIGLGRLQRLALQPLIRNMIAQPYDLYLKAQLRPDRLSESQIVRALKANQIDEQTARQMLAEKGYPDNLIDLLIIDLAGKIPVAELARLVRYAVLTEDQAVAKLTTAGIDAEDARLYLTAALAQEGDAQIGPILSNLETARLEGFLSQEEFSALVSDLPLSAEQERLFRKRVGNQLEHPRKHITFAELKTGLVHGIIDFDFADQWLTDQGYSDEEHLILIFELIQAIADADAKATAKQKTAAKLAAKGRQVPVVLAPSP
jgi:hypothetical protein